ncbi:hypothetical protein ABH940_004512 [Streptacidiphilus sp. BW17]|uniref:hypothetical protein n=1 Tax=Streptacidiphilus sp. BW17 TaxID=3156274 RepID=UPI003513B3BC
MPTMNMQVKRGDYEESLRFVRLRHKFSTGDRHQAQRGGLQSLQIGSQGGCLFAAFSAFL